MQFAIPGSLQPREIALIPRSVDPFGGLLAVPRWEAFQRAIRWGREVFDDRPIWCGNSTAHGGGVAEMLRTLLSYVRGAGIEAHWAVLAGDAQFFSITKRIHNFIHGSAGDGGPLGSDERHAYDRVMAGNLPGLLNLIAPGSVVMLHDPQTAGLVRPLLLHGCTVVWRCHIGIREPNAYSDQAWDFLEPDLRDADRLIFSQDAYVPAILANGPTSVVAPSIDPFSPKNQALTPEAVDAILSAAGLLARDPSGAAPVFHRLGGRSSEVRNRATLLDGGPPPQPDRPLVLQVSRWDRLKDHAGVMRGFAESALPGAGVDLMLAGPQNGSVSDDPEAKQVLDELLALFGTLPERVRRRIHIASLPTADEAENAAIVNALQRHAAVVVQKSIEEGFGLTVTEAMWKARPVVASGVGGIRAQVSDGRTGLLLDDPQDLPAFAEALSGLLHNLERAGELAAAGRASVLANFLPDRHLGQYMDLLGALDVRNAGAQPW